MYKDVCLNSLLGAALHKYELLPVTSFLGMKNIQMKALITTTAIATIFELKAKIIVLHTHSQGGITFTDCLQVRMMLTVH